MIICYTDAHVHCLDSGCKFKNPHYHGGNDKDNNISPLPKGLPITNEHAGGDILSTEAGPLLSAFQNVSTREQTIIVDKSKPLPVKETEEWVEKTEFELLQLEADKMLMEDTTDTKSDTIQVHYCSNNCNGSPSEYTFYGKESESRICSTTKIDTSDQAKVQFPFIMIESSTTAKQEVYDYLIEQKRSNWYYVKLIYIEPSNVGSAPWKSQIDFYPFSVLSEFLTTGIEPRVGIVYNRYANVKDMYVFTDAVEVNEQLQLQPPIYPNAIVIAMSVFKEYPRYVSCEEYADIMNAHKMGKTHEVVEDISINSVIDTCSVNLSPPSTNNDDTNPWGASPAISQTTRRNSSGANEISQPLVRRNSIAATSNWGPSPTGVEQTQQPVKMDRRPSIPSNATFGQSQVHPQSPVQGWGASPGVEIQQQSNTPPSDQPTTSWGLSPGVQVPQSAIQQPNTQQQTAWGISPTLSNIGDSSVQMTTLNAIKKKIKNEMPEFSKKVPVVPNKPVEQPVVHKVVPVVHKKRKRKSTNTRVSMGIAIDMGFKIQKKNDQREVRGQEQEESVPSGWGLSPVQQEQQQQRREPQRREQPKEPKEPKEQPRSQQDEQLEAPGWGVSPVQNNRHNAHQRTREPEQRHEQPPEQINGWGASPVNVSQQQAPRHREPERPKEAMRQFNDRRPLQTQNTQAEPGWGVHAHQTQRQDSHRLPERRPRKVQHGPPRTEEMRQEPGWGASPVSHGSQYQRNRSPVQHQHGTPRTEEMRQEPGWGASPVQTQRAQHHPRDNNWSSNRDHRDNHGHTNDRRERRHSPVKPEQHPEPSPWGISPRTQITQTAKVEPARATAPLGWGASPVVEHAQLNTIRRSVIQQQGVHISAMDTFTNKVEKEIDASPWTNKSTLHKRTDSHQTGPTNWGASPGLESVEQVVVKEKLVVKLDKKPKNLEEGDIE